MLEHLFSSYELKGKTVRNRIATSAMVTNYCDAGGNATERYIAYHEAKAKGGYGLLVTEDYAVDPAGRGFTNVAGLWDDSQIESHSKLTERVHKYGALILAQIYHCGRQTSRAVIGTQPIAPTALPDGIGPDVPRAMTLAEITKVIGQFGDTALRAKKAGFDGVQIHAGHGYLVAEFLSPYANKRTDAYGGTFFNRARFLLEVIQDIRKKCGDDFIIDMKISGDECIEGGRTLSDTIEIVKLSENAGIDMVTISAGTYASGGRISPSPYIGHAWLQDQAAEVRKGVKIPVSVVGRINDPFIAESVLAQGNADFVAMARESLIDPEMPNKAKEGRFQDIRHCIACLIGCMAELNQQHPIRCALNPTLGREYEGGVKKTENPKKVAVIGAGPAGLSAAITAAKAGHTVTVYEKEDHAGGLGVTASLPPCKGEIAGFIGWLTTQCGELGVTIRYNTEASVQLLKKEAPDVVITAEGGRPSVPPIPGRDSKNVITAQDLLHGKAAAGMHCVVIGGGEVGAETAHFLAQQLRDVTILEMRDAIAPEEFLGNRLDLLAALKARDVAMYTGVATKQITNHSVQFEDHGTLREIPADTVVMATGYRPVTALADQLEAAGFTVKRLSHKNGIGNFLECTTEGYEAGLAI